MNEIFGPRRTSSALWRLAGTGLSSSRLQSKSPRKGQRASSRACRWALWNADQQVAAQARDRKIREYLVMAEGCLDAAKRLLEGGRRRGR